MLMSFMSCSIIVAWHENRDPSSIASGEHSPNIYIYINIYIYGLDQAVTESHFCCSSFDIFLMEKVRKSCFIWLCRALKVL